MKAFLICTRRYRSNYSLSYLSFMPTDPDARRTLYTLANESLWKPAYFCLWPCSLARMGLCFLWFFVQELPKAQPAVVLVLKRLRRRGNSLKSHPTDWEKPGIEPATPGYILFVAVFLGCTSTGRVGSCFFVVLCPGNPEGSTGSGSGFKASQKTGNHWLYMK